MNKTLKAIGLLCMLWAGSAAAQTQAWNEIKGELKAALEAKGDAQRGAAAFEQCEGCHRKDASGRVSGAYPRLAGQHATVLMKQIADIRSGLRTNPKMEPFVDNHVLTPFEIADLSVYLESLPISDTNGKGAEAAAAQGKALYAKACVQCHGVQGEGQAAKFYPMVAAQHYKYLLRQMQLIRDGDRRNGNPDMIAVIKAYSSSDLEALAAYMAQLPPPPRKGS